MKIQQNNQPLLIYPSSRLRDSYEPKTKKFSNPMRAFLDNPLFVLWLTLIMDLANPDTFSEIF
jgi:hypothetical protein